MQKKKEIILIFGVFLQHTHFKKMRSKVHFDVQLLATHISCLNVIYFESDICNFDMIIDLLLNQFVIFLNAFF